MIEKLKWITWSIMPLVYDESLSYVELLDKVIAKLNEVIEARQENTIAIDKITDIAFIFIFIPPFVVKIFFLHIILYNRKWLKSTIFLFNF